MTDFSFSMDFTNDYLHFCFVRACGRGRMSEKALELLEEAKENKIALDAYIYTAVIDGAYILHTI